MGSLNLKQKSGQPYMESTMEEKSLTLDEATSTRFSEIVRSFSKAKILVIGDFILDEFIWGDVNRISPEAPVPVVNVKEQSFMPGGSLNVAHNIQCMKAQVYPCGVLGRDLYGRMLTKEMRKEGIQTDGIIYDKERPTTLKTRIIAHSQQVVRFDRENVSPILEKDAKQIVDFVSKKIDQVDVVIIEDYGKGLITKELLKEVIGIAKEHKKKIVVDPKEKHFSYYEGVTAITPNHHEAIGAVKDHENQNLTIEEVGQKLLDKLGCDGVLLTRGKDGMALFEKDGSVTQVKAAAQEVYDVAGAGDTVVSVFSLALAVGATMKEAAMISNLAAGVVVSKVGVAVCLPDELIQVIQSGKTLG